MEHLTSPDHDGLYEWFMSGEGLLREGRPAEAAEMYARVLLDEPTSRSAWEGLARARFDSRDYRRAADAFERLVELAPDDDYAHFGRGLSLWRLGRFGEACDHLGMARAMRPDRAEYAAALGQVRATIRARAEAGLPADLGPGERRPDG